MRELAEREKSERKRERSERGRERGPSRSCASSYLCLSIKRMARFERGLLFGVRYPKECILVIRTIFLYNKAYVTPIIVSAAIEQGFLNSIASSLISIFYF